MPHTTDAQKRIVKTEDIRNKTGAKRVGRARQCLPAPPKMTAGSEARREGVTHEQELVANRSGWHPFKVPVGRRAGRSTHRCRLVPRETFRWAPGRRVPRSRGPRQSPPPRRRQRPQGPHRRGCSRPRGRRGGSSPRPPRTARTPGGPPGDPRSQCRPRPPGSPGAAGCRRSGTLKRRRVTPT